MAVSPIEQKLLGSDISLSVLEGILNASRESILVVNSAMCVMAANEPAQEAFARHAEPLNTRRLTEIVRDVDLHDGFQQTLNNNRATDLRIEFNGIEKRTYDVHIAPVELDGTVHAIGVFYDITQIERLEKVRQEFLSNI